VCLVCRGYGGYAAVTDAGIFEELEQEVVEGSRPASGGPRGGRRRGVESGGSRRWKQGGPGESVARAGKTGGSS
jgi:hypothetical protein